MKRISTILLAVVLAGCGARRVGQQQDAAPVVDGRSTVDARVPDGSTVRPDAATPRLDAALANCVPTLQWGFVSDAPPTDAQDYEVSGSIAYLGPVTEPLASNPQFDRELQLVDEEGRRVLLLQYFLPPGLDLPVGRDGAYTFIIRRRWVFEGRAEALVIRRQTSGLWPLLFVGEPGLMGQALDLDDELISPVTIEQLEDRPCELTATICGTGAHLDRLRFRVTTGAGVRQLELAQGERGALSFFGVSYDLLNLASYRVARPCPGEPDARLSYLLLARDPWPP